MALPPPRFSAVQAVLQLPNPLPRDPSMAERFIEAVRPEFPHLQSRQVLAPEVPVQAPHVTLSSSSSQLALSAAQADFQVRFYGKFLEDIDLALEYVERKVLTALAGLSAMDATPATVGLIGTFNFSFAELGEEPAAHVLRTHLRTEVEPDHVQDALARLALKVRDTYFVHMTVTNYESRVLERPILPGLPQQIRVRPWEGRVEDYGVELALDINNNLEGRTQQADPEVTEEGVRAVVRLLRQVAHSAGPEFVESGRISVDDLAASSAA